jgi:hypothetical protein
MGAGPTHRPASKGAGPSRGRHAFKQARELDQLESDTHSSKQGRRAITRAVLQFFRLASFFRKCVTPEAKSGAQRSSLRGYAILMKSFKESDARSWLRPRVYMLCSCFYFVNVLNGHSYLTRSESDIAYIYMFAIISYDISLQLRINRTQTRQLDPSIASLVFDAGTVTSPLNCFGH